MVERSGRLVPVITCEHGGNRVPEEFRGLFAGREQELAGHRGWDAGALELARQLARRLRAPLFSATVTRLLVDLNRSEDSAELFSEVTGALPEQTRNRIVEEHYFPYRHAVETALAGAMETGDGPVLHLSVHTFTPVWDGQRREVEVGVLFDPERRPEVAFWERFRDALATRRPELAVRPNRPYLGTADGFTSYLRRRFPAGRYLGIELEVSLALVRGEGWSALKTALVEASAAAGAGPPA